MLKNIVIVGASGLGIEILQIIEKINKKSIYYNILGFIDDNVDLKDSYINDYKILGGVEYFETNSSCSIVIAIANVEKRCLLVSKINKYKKNHEFPNIIHPNVEIDNKYIHIGNGNIITDGCILTSNIKIGSFNIFNTRSTIGHDVSIIDYNTFNPNVQISGNVNIGCYNFIAVNSVILQGIKVGNNNNIGACSLVIKNLKNDMKVFGIPAQNFKF